MTSLAMPAIGTGYNNYRPERLAALFYGCIKNFDYKNPSPTIKKITFVIRKEDFKILDVSTCMCIS